MIKQSIYILFFLVMIANSYTIASDEESVSHYFWGGKNTRDIVVYSARKTHLIKPLFDAFTDHTGISIKFLTGKSGALIERLKLEGKNSNADLLMTVDAGNLWYAKTQGLFQEVRSDYLDSTLPDYLTDRGNTWFGLSVRARTLVYHTDRVSPKDLSTYEDLSNEEWEGRVCLRSSKKVYNKSLVASMIYYHGAKKTKTIVKGWVNNLASKPFAKDSQVMNAILAGQCDVGLVNTYYFSRLKAKQPNTPIALFWANQQTTGTHINVSGAGILKYAPSPELAKRLLEWLSSAQAQRIYAQINQEYPANQNISSDGGIVSSWGNFKHDTMDLIQVGQLQEEAVKLMQEVGYR